MSEIETIIKTFCHSGQFGHGEGPECEEGCQALPLPAYRLQFVCSVTHSILNLELRNFLLPLTQTGKNATFCYVGKNMRIFPDFGDLLLQMLEFLFEFMQDFRC